MKKPDGFDQAPEAPERSPQPDVIPEAAPPGQERDSAAGLQPIDGSEAPSQGTRQRARAERESTDEAIESDDFVEERQSRADLDVEGP